MMEAVDCLSINWKTDWTDLTLTRNKILLL